MPTALVTGAAGFIGYFVSARLAAVGYRVVGLDNLSDYYDVTLKEARLRHLQNEAPRFEFLRADLVDREAISGAFATLRPDYVVHLAAQPGVRYSLVNPCAYVDSNVQGFLNILEGCRQYGVRHLVFASSSSVYGGNTKVPFSTHDSVDHPLSLYAATKKANELMAHAYAHLFRIPSTGLRFFTVYGPWGRPDMAPMLFAHAILEGVPIRVFNHGEMKRDFTYVDDVVEGLVRVIARPAVPDPAWSGAAPDPRSSFAPYRIYNIGNSAPVGLLRFIEVLEGALGRRAVIERVPMQPGDVPETFADIGDLEREFDFRPSTSIEEGVARFAVWYRGYHGHS